MYALDGQPKTVEEAVDRMQFFQHSRQGRTPKPKREVRTFGPEEESSGMGDGRPSREILHLQSRIVLLHPPGPRQREGVPLPATNVGRWDISGGTALVTPGPWRQGTWGETGAALSGVGALPSDEGYRWTAARNRGPSAQGTQNGTGAHPRAR